jgi:hypothetical protein
MKIRLIDDETPARRFENITNVEFAGDTIVVESMFEAPQTLCGFVLDKIDCLHHTVVLRRASSTVHERGIA